jgi:hypothetical protein
LTSLQLTQQLLLPQPLQLVSVGFGKIQSGKIKF